MTDWTDLSPIVRVTHSVTARITVPKDGRPRVHLSFSDSFFKDLGRPELANVQASAGRVRLLFAPEGKFSIKALELGGARLMLPHCPGAPDGARENEACEVELKSEKEVVLRLPVELWEKQLNRPLAPTAPVQPVKISADQIRAQLPQAKHTVSGKINVVDYLSRRGIKVERSGTQFKIDDVLETRAGAMTIVNRHRRAAGLEAIGLGDIE